MPDVAAPHPLGPLEPLTAFHQFIVALLVPLPDGKVDKLPIDYRTCQVPEKGSDGAHDPAIWLSYGSASEIANALGPAYRVGFVITAADPWVCVDIDGALDVTTGKWSDTAHELCHAMQGAVIERSQSGHGLHAWARLASVPAHAKKRTDRRIEAYSARRFIVLGTEQAGTLADDCPAMRDVLLRYFPPREAADHDMPDSGPCAGWAGPEDDDALIVLAMRSRSAASVFGDGLTFADLWAANADALGRKWPAGGRPYDASSADASLAAKLAFWTGRDAARIDRMMRRSSLVRDKWDRPDYLPRTIANACAQTREVYHSGKAAPPVPLALSGPVRLVRGDAVTIEPIRWLWDGFLPAGMLTIIGGAPGCGKTTIGLSLAATITRGATWPDGTRCANAGDVLVWSGEDPQSVLAGRLLAMGADLARVYFIDGIGEGTEARSFDPGKDMVALELMASQLPAPGLLIVDPIVSAVTGDGHKSNEVRRALQPVVDLGQHLKCAVLGITHFTKGTAGRDPVERITGSLAFGALARLVLVAAKVKAEEGAEPRRLLMRAKSSNGPDDGGFAYALDRVPVAPGVEGQRVRWLDALHGTARTMLAEAEGNPSGDADDDSSRSDIKAFVRTHLSPGVSVSSTTLEVDASAAGLRWPKVRTVAKEMGAAARKTPGTQVGGWRWEIVDEAKWARSL